MLTRALPYYEFCEGVFEIDEFDCASIFVIVGEKRALVLDCGTGIGDLRWVIENRITDKPYDVVLTHNHADHIGGAGFFDEVWIHEADSDWSDLLSPLTTENRKDLPAPLTPESRKGYAQLIRCRENKNYIYDPERDIVGWQKNPVKKILKDGQIFDLGGRKVSIYHCPGHTEGECVAIDDKSKLLFCGDACNRNFLLNRNVGGSQEEALRMAQEGLERIYAMRGTAFEAVYNGHHDFRGIGSPLGDEVLPNIIACLKSMREGTAKILQVPDQLSVKGAVKEVAEYGNVQITWLG